MTYAAPSCDFYDDGLVHSHNWANSTPPGGNHAESRRTTSVSRSSHDHDDGLVHEHGWARQ